MSTDNVNAARFRVHSIEGPSGSRQASSDKARAGRSATRELDRSQPEKCPPRQSAPTSGSRQKSENFPITLSPAPLSDDENHVGALWI